MPNVNWIGGATAVAQIDVLQITLTWASADTLTITLTANDGSTKQVITATATSSAIETGVRDVLLALLQASNQTLFSVITWAASSTDSITGTAKTAGVPFFQTEAESTAGNGVAAITNDGSGSSKLSEGPNDWAVDGTGNYSTSNFTDETEALDTGGIVNDDDIKILPHPDDVDAAGNQVSYDILYSLHVDSAIDVNSFRIPPSYRGLIGQSSNKYYLQLDCTSNGGVGITVIESNAKSIWLKGTHTAITVAALPNTSKALMLAGGTITDLRVLGGRVQGRIDVADGTVVTNYYQSDSPATVHLGTSGTATTLANITSGNVTIDHETTTITASGGVVTHTKGTTATINNHGAHIFYNGTGNIGTALNNYSGTMDFSRNTTHGLSVAATKIWGGIVTDLNGLKNITYTGNVIKYGGQFLSDSATTVAQS